MHSTSGFLAGSFRSLLIGAACLALAACGGGGGGDGGGGGGGGGGTANRAPVLGAIGARSMAEGAQLAISVTATDADSNPLTFSAVGLPAFATFTDNGNGTATLSAAPNYTHSGAYTITVNVADNASPALTDSEAFVLTVNNANSPPQITAIADRQIDEGTSVQIAVTATDPEGDAITLTRTGPAFATLTDNGNGTGTLRLAPGYTDSGTHTITVRATDNSTPPSFSEDAIVVTVIDQTANQVALENQLPGTSQWRLTNPAQSREIEGYASATSVNRGDVIRLYVNTASPSFDIEVFRMGWYQGLGARRVFGPERVTGSYIQPIPPPNSSTRLVDANNWQNPFVLDTETGGAPWRTGVYLARLTETTAGKQSYAIFVVRDDSRTPEVLFGLPVTTYQSYNAWGGHSLYSTQSGGPAYQPWGAFAGQRATKVSFNRPYAASPDPAAAYGVGAGEFLTNTQPVSPNPDNYPISSAGWDYNMVRWLEYEQYDVGYITNIDYHRTSAHLNGIDVFLSPGHDEYWSWEMYDHVEAARDAGIDLAFFSANSIFRQVRFEPSNPVGGSPEQNQRIMVHYREIPDPNPTGNPNLVTVEFRDVPPGRPEQNLMGVQFVEESGQPVDGDIVITNASHPIFARTGLTNGSRLAGLLGYEVDGRYGGFGNIVELASSPFTTINTMRSGTSHMTIYPVGTAEVFATGSIQWSWGLDDFNSLLPRRGARLSAAAQQITANVLERFGATPYVPAPVAAQCVRLTALSNANGDPAGSLSWASAAEIDLLGANGVALDKSTWTIVADSQETSLGSNAASNAIDGLVNTFWHSAYSASPLPPLPHTLTINLGTVRNVSALRYLPRQDGGTNGVIARYEVHTADSCSNPTWTRVSNGNWFETPTVNVGRKIARFTR